MDTGTTTTSVLRDFVHKGQAKGRKGHTSEWKTLGGQFKTHQKALTDFKFPELCDHKKVMRICHVDDRTKPEDSMCDMIIGVDSMTEIGICIDTEEKRIKWDGGSTPPADKGALQHKEAVQQVCALTQEPSVLGNAEIPARKNPQC